LKLSRLSAERTDCGKLFHAFGPAIENALSPRLIIRNTFGRTGHYRCKANHETEPNKLLVSNDFNGSFAVEAYI